MNPAAPTSLADLLAFYAEAGVDAALEEAGVNRFTPAGALAEAQPAAAQAQEPDQRRAPSRPDLTRTASSRTASPPHASPRAVLPDDSQAAAARELAAKAATLDDLRAIMQAFDGCNLKATAKQLVFADGNPAADLMLVGEAPGRDEDIEGRPFVGRSGQLLDRILAAIGRDRTSAYIANVVPWRPPGNRTPTPLETEICRPFIERQIELANPKVLVTLGGPSAKTLLRATDGVLKLRGTWRTYVTAAGVEIPIMPTLHPAYLLRTPAHKKLVWRDFLEVKMRLDASR